MKKENKNVRKKGEEIDIEMKERKTKEEKHRT